MSPHALAVRLASCSLALEIAHPSGWGLHRAAGRVRLNAGAPRRQKLRVESAEESADVEAESDMAISHLMPREWIDQVKTPQAAEV